MAILLDEVTKAAYDALTVASDRAAAVVAALSGTVVIEVYDGANVLCATGTMVAPWATASGSTITVGEVNATGILVTTGGVPTALWYCQFRSGTRFVRGTFGVAGSGRDFVWSLSAFEAGSRGTIGTATLTASGTTVTNSPPVWTTVPSITITQGSSVSLPGLGYVYDPDNDAMTFAVVSGTLPTGVSLNASTGVLTASGAANVVTGAGPIVVSASDSSTVVEPSNTVAPVVSGLTTVNSVLSATTGTWTGTAPITYVYRWLRNGATISGATASTYVLVTADIGALISVSVTATNAGGSVAASSSTVGPITNPSSGVLSVPFTLTSAVGGSNLPWTFGHAFKQGDWASGTITASTGEFQAVPTTYWPDGSVRHAIISGRTTLSAGVATALTLAAGTPTAGSVLTTTDLQSAIPATTTITVAGTTMTLAGSFLASYQREVCAGAVMSNWLYRLPVSGSSHVVIWADVRLYKGGTVEIFPWVENAYLNVPSPTSAVGVACAVVVGGVSVFSTTFTVAHHTRIPLLTGSTFSYWTSDPEITPKHDTTYLRGTKMVPNYGTVTPSTGTLNALQQTYTPNTIAGVSGNMGSAGGSGAVVGWYGLPAQPFYCITGDVRAYRAAIAFGLSGGSWSTHYRDSATNEFIRYDQHAATGLDTVASGSGTTNGTFAVTHQPSFGYLPWLVTGRWWFLDETLSAATYNYLAQAAQRRRGETSFSTAPYYAASGSAGIIDPRAGTYTVRGAAWSLNSLFLAHAILPTTHTCYESIKATTEWNTAFYKATFVDGTHAPGHVNQLGILGTYSSGGTSLYGTGHSATSNYWYDAGWQHAMMVQVWGFARALSLTQTPTSQTAMEAVSQHGLRLPAGLAGDGGTGNWNWRRFIVYHFPIGQDAVGLPVDTPAATFGEARTEYERELGTLATTAGLPLKLHSSNSDYTSTGTSSFTYGSQMIAALALAVDAGSPGAAAGMGRISGYGGQTPSSSWAVMQSEFALDPTYYFVPRS